MAEEEKEKQGEEQKDNRLRDARAVQDLMKHPGFTVLQSRWEEAKLHAGTHLRDESLPNDHLRAAQAVFNAICDWIDLPDQVIREGVDALDNPEENRKDHPIKEGITFVRRQY